MSSSGEASNKIGLVGVVFTLIGFVIGASIFVLPGELYAVAGPAMLLSFLIASIPAAGTCLTAAQIAAAFPGNGANILAVRALVSPMAGFAVAWFIIGSSIVALALLALGFADYLAVMVPSLGGGARAVTAVAVTLLFALINSFGARAAVVVQSAMVIWLVLILILFTVMAVPEVDMSHFTPFASKGASAIATAVIPAFFAFLGFTLIVEVSGDVDRPARTLPLALAISYGIILLTYIGVAAGVVGILPPDRMAGDPAPVAEAAEFIMPGWLAGSIVISALLAAATSVNGVLLLVSRDLAELGHEGYLPAWLGGGHGKAPVAAIWSVALIACGAIAVSSSITRYAVATVLGYMVAQALVALAALRLPASPELPIGRGLTRAAGWLTFGSALLFFIVAGLSDLAPVAAVLGYAALGAAIFLARKDQAISPASIDTMKQG